MECVKSCQEKCDLLKNKPSQSILRLPRISLDILARHGISHKILRNASMLRDCWDVKYVLRKGLVERAMAKHDSGEHMCPTIADLQDVLLGGRRNFRRKLQQTVRRPCSPAWPVALRTPTRCPISGLSGTPSSWVSTWPPNN